MKCLLVGVFILFSVTEASSLRCYVCAGTGDVCSKARLEKDKIRFLVNCSSGGFNMCLGIWAKKDSMTALVKSCGNRAAYDTSRRECEQTEEGSCFVDGCNSDGCNADTNFPFWHNALTSLILLLRNLCLFLGAAVLIRLLCSCVFGLTLRMNRFRNRTIHVQSKQIPSAYTILV